MSDISDDIQILRDWCYKNKNYWDKTEWWSKLAKASGNLAKRHNFKHNDLIIDMIMEIERESKEV